MLERDCLFRTLRTSQEGSQLDLVFGGDLLNIHTACLQRHKLCQRPQPTVWFVLGVLRLTGWCSVRSASQPVTDMLGSSQVEHEATGSSRQERESLFCCYKRLVKASSSCLPVTTV